MAPGVVNDVMVATLSGASGIAINGNHLAGL